MKNKILKLGISSREAEELIKSSKNIAKDYKKLLKGYPIQYLIGYSNFYGYKFIVSRKVLIPRFETEFLVEKTINYIKTIFKNPIRIIDMGTGSGCIAISLQKKFKDSIVEGVDISCGALNISKKNNKINNTNVKFYKHNILKPLRRKYDVIISNPPYVCKNEKIDVNVKKYEPNKALYADKNGLQFYENIIINSKTHLTEHGIIAFEIGLSQSKDIKKIAKQVYPNAQIIIEKDLSNRERYVFILT